MEFSVGEMLNASIEIENAGKYPKIRLLTTQRNQSGVPEEELLAFGMNWTVASPQSVGSGYTSAICWLYGRMVHEALGGRPMGLIHSSWGATEIEFWSPPQALKDCGISSYVFQT
jgi:sialate O-acetylesterase